MSTPLECGCLLVMDGLNLVSVQCETHKQIKRDERWEDVYASKGPYWHIHDTDNEEGACDLCSYIHYKLDVYYKGGHYWTWQLIDSADFQEANADAEIDKWLWQEMIGIVDDRMKGVVVG